MTSKSKKKVDFSVRPRPVKDALPPSPDDWVRGGTEPEIEPQKGKGADPGPQKRLTLNLPADLHTTFKSHCVIEGVTIQDKVQLLIEREIAADRPMEGGKPVVA